MQKILSLIILLVYSYILAAQASDSTILIQRNQQIDNYVVEHNTTALDSMYANDFVFSHGSGRVEGKDGWFVSVAKGNFISRQNDSVSVEFHPQVAIVKGKLSVQKKGKEKINKYHLYYIRVFALRNKSWQMISHITTREYHEL